MKNQPNAALKGARTKAAMTQRQVAMAAKVSESCYQRYELGLVEPKARIASRIAKTLNSTVEELFGEA